MRSEHIPNHTVSTAGLGASSAPPAGEAGTAQTINNGSFAKKVLDDSSPELEAATASTDSKTAGATVSKGGVAEILHSLTTPPPHPPHHWDGHNGEAWFLAKTLNLVFTCQRADSASEVPYRAFLGVIFSDLPREGQSQSGAPLSRGTLNSNAGYSTALPYLYQVNTSDIPSTRVATGVPPLRCVPRERGEQRVGRRGCADSSTSGRPEAVLSYPLERR